MATSLNLSEIPSREYVISREQERDRVVAEIEMLKERLHQLETRHKEISDEVDGLWCLRTPRLTTDIIYSFLSYFVVHPKLGWKQQHDNRYQKTSRYNACLVSRQWLRPARIALYHTICVDHRFRADSFLAHLENSPLFRPLVRRLFLGARLDVARWCSLLPDLNTLSIDIFYSPKNINWEQIAQSLTSLTDIRLTIHKHLPLGTLFTTISQTWPTLRSLAILGPCWLYNLIEDTVVAPLPSLHYLHWYSLPWPGCFGPSFGSSLRVIDMNSLQIPSFEVLATILQQACNTVEELGVWHCYAPISSGDRFHLPFSPRLQVIQWEGNRSGPRHDRVEIDLSQSRLRLAKIPEFVSF